MALLTALSSIAGAQQRAFPIGPVVSDIFRTVYIRLSPVDEALLYEPRTPGPNSRVALVVSHPDGNAFDITPALEMAKRGYRVLAMNHHGESADITVFGQPLSRAIGYLRTQSGVQHVVIMGHSGGAEIMAWYQNVAEHGPAACQGSEKIYPCDGAQLTGLNKPDGMILLDSPLGAFHAMSAIDPAVDGEKRIPSLDMFSADNNYHPETGRAKYSPDFARRFYTGQTMRNGRLIENALARLHAIKQGEGPFSDDEPLVVRGMGAEAAGARLYQPDPSFAANTASPHRLLKADGSQPEVIVTSVRPSTGQQFAHQLNSLHVMSQETTVRQFLAHSAIRTTASFAITADGIQGVDWASAVNSPPANVEGISAPALILSNSCHYLVVPDEMIFNHLNSKDKTLVYVEGATHNFTPCRPEYGDTVRRAFDYVDQWLNKTGRF